MCNFLKRNVQLFRRFQQLKNIALLKQCYIFYLNNLTTPFKQLLQSLYHHN